MADKARPKEKEKEPAKPSKGKEKEKEKEHSSDEEDFDLDDSDEGHPPASTSSSQATGTPAKKSNWLQKKKRGMASSAVGSAIVQNLMDKETKLLIKTICIIIEKDKGKPTAQKVKKYVFAIATKAALLYQDKLITANDFGGLTASFRRICSATRNGFREKKLDAATAERIATVMQAFGSGVRAIVGPYISKNTINKIDYLLNYVCQKDFLLRASVMPEFSKVCYVLAYYLQESSNTV